MESPPGQALEAGPWDEERAAVEVGPWDEERAALEAGPWDVGAGAGAQGIQPDVNVEAQGLVQPGAHRGFCDLGAGAVADDLEACCDVEAGAGADVAAGADEILNSSTSTCLFPN